MKPQTIIKIYLSGFIPQLASILLSKLKSILTVDFEWSPLLMQT